MKSHTVNRVGMFFYLAVVMLTASLLAAQSSSSTSSSTTPVPRLIKFSGAVKDDQGRPKTGVVGVTFALYQDQDRGSPLWLETQNVQADSKGNYTALLGSTKSEGLPAELFASNEARWLGVQPEGQAEQPRVLLLSVPYALKAVDAETLSGKPASAFVLAETGSRLGDPGVITSATSGKTATGQPLASITGSGTTNRVAKFTGTRISRCRSLTPRGQTPAVSTGCGLWMENLPICPAARVIPIPRMRKMTSFT